MKRIALKILLLLLVILEIYLCSAFLPARWQFVIQQGLHHVLPQTSDHSVITHPALDQEIEQVLRQNLGLRAAVYAFLLAMLAGNTFLLVKIWRRLRPSSRHAGAD